MERASLRLRRDSSPWEPLLLHSAASPQSEPSQNSPTQGRSQAGIRVGSRGPRLSRAVASWYPLVTLQRVQVAVHAAEVHHAFVNNRRRHDRPDAHELEHRQIHVLKVAKDRPVQDFLLQSSISIQDFERIFHCRIQLKLPYQLSGIHIDGIKPAVVI